ncbi:MAG TPA: hypothetical protein VGF24_24325 [Vicinamibacterales bacterium]|jgi:dipeptidyl aminopeptidase/acylaminoacyl peptidase
MIARRVLCLVVVGLFAAGVGAAGRQGDDQRHVNVRDARLSPDGGTVVFARGEEPRDSNPRASSGLWRVPFAGGDPQPLTREPAASSHPRWSPDGRQIGYVSAPLRNGAAARVFVVSAEGGAPRAVTPDAVDVVAFEWSPDGRRLAFITQGSSQPGLSIIGADGNGLRSLVPGTAAAVSWAPTGTEIAVVLQDPGARSRVVIARTAGTTPARAIEGQFLPRVSWSPDGSAIALIGPRESGVSRLTLLGPNGRVQREIPLRSDEPLDDAVWTGDGRISLTFSGSAQTWIEVLTPATDARLTVFPPGLATITSRPSWSRDGRRYVVLAHEREHGDEVFAGTIPLPERGVPDFAGARPVPVRRITGD